MTVEEIDIIVEASVEQAVKEFNKLLPAIKKQLSGIQREFDRINIKEMKADINILQVTKKVKLVGKQIKDAFNTNDISGMQINGKAFEIKNIKGYSKEIQKLKGQTGILNKIKPEMPKVEQTGTSQNKWASFFNGFKEKLEQAKTSVGNIKNLFKQMPNITQGITNGIKKMGTGIKAGLGHVFKYVSTLFSLKRIYGILSGSAQSWLSSQNGQAQQLSANIEYMKYAMGSTFAPIIQYVINLVYQLMKAIQSVVYAFSGVNIFAKATATSMGKTAKSAKQTNKSLAGAHSEINNVSEKDSGSDGGVVNANMDLSQMDNQMNPLAQKLHDFFKPLVNSWNTYGKGLVEQVKITAGQIGGLIASVWNSFESIITNGTIYSILQNILAIIGNIAEAFTNVWNYNGNGDAIVQNLADAFNNLLIAIDNVVQNEGFQNFLNWCSDKFRKIAEKIESIDWQPVMDALSTIGESVGTIALEILDGLVNIFKWLVENPIVAEILLAIAIAIGILATAISIYTTAIEIYNVVMPIATAASTAFSISIGGLVAIIIGVIAVIALIVLAIMNWNTIMEWLKQTVETVVNAVVEFFTNLWSKVSVIFETIWQIISTIFQAIWNVISTILSSVWNIFSQIFNWIWQLVSKVFEGIWNVISPIMNNIWQTIKFLLDKIQQIWSVAWNMISNIVNSIWNGIWNGIKTVINWILGGIEGFVNGAIRGINFLLKGLSKVANAIGSLIGLEPINLQINLISLPRLAKGNVAYSPLIAQFGEYAGASHNPEITTPQNIMAETFENVLSNHEWNTGNNSNGEIKQVVIQFGSYRVATEMESLLRQSRRQNGTATVTI